MTSNSLAKTATAMEDYITVVEVDDGTKSQHTNYNKFQQPLKAQSSQEDSSYITVLNINNGVSANQEANQHETKLKSDDNDTELVNVYRLPGERLGFGLKFQGGTRNTEKVHKLYIQSCSEESPASKVIASWGPLREGDEIVGIDGCLVKDMTRIECVRCLKDNVAIRLQVRNGHGQKPDINEDHIMEHHFGDDKSCISHTNKVNGHNNLNPKLGQPPPPPPVPPRKLFKRKSFKERLPLIINNANSKMDSSFVADKPFTPPPDAEYYINLFSDGQSGRAESESDDTASTISTVIDKFSMSSNYSSDSDLSSFTSHNTNGTNNTDLVNVLKPFTMLEQEFKVNTSMNMVLESSMKLAAAELIAGNNYENVEFKTEKVNTYENFNFNAKCAQQRIDMNEGDGGGPTPKPRHVLSNTDHEDKNAVNSTTSTFFGKSTSPINGGSVTAGCDVKKRSIIPMPRKYGSPAQGLIEVLPPKVPDSPSSLKTPTNAPQGPAEFTTKIPKAIASPSSLQRLPQRAKTESDIKIKSNNGVNDASNKKIATAMFLENEHRSDHNNSDNNKKQNKPLKTSQLIKSRIPVVLSPKRSFEGGKSPANIKPIVMQKQKSETDLMLGLYRSKESSPLSKLPLQRTISVESKLKSSDRIVSYIPMPRAMSSSSESLHSGSSPARVKGPKPKPPERIQSLLKTQIPKFNSTAVAVAINDRHSQTSANQIPTLKTFSHSPPSRPQDSPLPSKTSEIRFKIQTYESKAQHQNDIDLPTVDVTDNVELNNVPSLYDFVRNKNSLLEKKKPDETISDPQHEDNTVNKDGVMKQQSAVTVGKCIKVTEDQQTFYSSSSSDDGEVEDNTESGSARQQENDDDDDDEDEDDEDNGKDYICEAGEKLGPPEVVNGPGPSEAYFNLYWHSNVLPTIGEVEEECSSLEQQLLSIR